MIGNQYFSLNLRSNDSCHILYNFCVRFFSVFYSGTTGTVSLSAVDTVGTDRTLGTISGTFTPVVSDSGTTHVTVGITRAGGVAGQEGMAISARVRSHITK
jgi:hypothetical protein